MGKRFFERHFDSDDQKNVILAPLINCHDPVRKLFQGNQIYTVVISIMLNSFLLMSLSIHSTVKQNIDKINSTKFDLFTLCAFLQNGLLDF